MEKDALLERVLDLELEMFVLIKSAHPAVCQSDPDKFKAVRGSVFTMWTAEMLAAYLEQIESAKVQGRNLLTEKYARMDDLIPPLTEDPLIDDIVDMNLYWQFELQKLYPALCKRCCRSVNGSADGSNFSVYFRSELETYGGRTLELYYQNVLGAYDQNRNLTAEALLALVQKSGYQDLEHAELCLSNEVAVKPVATLAKRYNKA
jgi:hypothetical protein